MNSFSDYSDQGQAIGKIIGMVIIAAVILGIIIYLVNKQRNKPKCDSCNKKLVPGHLTLKSKSGNNSRNFCNEECQTDFLNKLKSKSGKRR